MKALNTQLLLGLLIMTQCIWAQDDAAADGGDDAAEGSGEDKEECEEAWDYVNFLKDEIKEKLEAILQETLFETKPLLEQTVTETVEQVLAIRDKLLERTKAIRTEDGSVTICEEQNIRQEEFLTMIRMDIMTVLLSLIEKDAATTENLQDIGRNLLSIRTKVNGEITKMIMLRSSNRGPTRDANECDCKSLSELVNDLDKVIDGDKGAEDDADVTDDDTATDSPDGGDGEEGGSEDVVGDLTETLMKVDTEIRNLYNDILSELDEMKREELSEKLLKLKTISTDLHAAISKLVTLDPEEDKDAIKRFIKRDVKAIRNAADRLLKECQEKCPSQCESCGSEKIFELEQKLDEYKITLEEAEGDDGKDALNTIRADLMSYLAASSSEMTELLKAKAEDPTKDLEKCEAEKLEVINKIKGPLWMMVNVTIFGEAATAIQMIEALETVLEELRTTYCAPGEAPAPRTELGDDCDIQEIETARGWIIDIDTIISENLFKATDDPEARKNAMIGFIDLKSSMDDRVRKLFQNQLQCKEEVEQIKNIYSHQLTECLAELMNPKYLFEGLDRSKKVQCIKGLRVTIEDRRGELLYREIEKKIQALESNGDAESLPL